MIDSIKPYDGGKTPKLQRIRKRILISCICTICIMITCPIVFADSLPFTYIHDYIFDVYMYTILLLCMVTMFTYLGIYSIFYDSKSEDEYTESVLTEVNYAFNITFELDKLIDLHKELCTLTDTNYFLFRNADIQKLLIQIRERAYTINHINNSICQ